VKLRKVIVLALFSFLILSGCNLNKLPLRENKNEGTPKFDLKIFGVEISPSEPVEGEKVDFNLSLNQTETHSLMNDLNCSVKISIDKNVLCEFLQPLKDNTVNFYSHLCYWVATKGFHLLEIEVRPLDFIDPDLTNNKYTQSFNVLERNLLLEYKAKLPVGTSYGGIIEILGDSNVTASSNGICIHLGNLLLKIDKKSGKILNEINLSEYAYNSNISTNVLFVPNTNIAYFGSESGSLLGLDIRKKNLLFKIHLKDKPLRIQQDDSYLYVTAERSYVDTPGHIVYKLDEKGNLIWSFNPEDRISLLTLWLDNKNIYFSSHSSGYPYLYSIDKENGNLKMKKNFYDFGCSAISRPIVYEISASKAFLLTDIGAVCFDLKTQKILWKNDRFTGSEAPLGINLFGGFATNLVSIDENTGNVIREYELYRLNGKIWCDELVYTFCNYNANSILARGNVILGLNLPKDKTPQLRYSLDNFDEIILDLIVDEVSHTLFAISDKFNLYAIKLPENKGSSWEFTDYIEVKGKVGENLFKGIVKLKRDDNLNNPKFKEIDGKEVILSIPPGLSTEDKLNNLIGHEIIFWGVWEEQPMELDGHSYKVLYVFYLRDPEGED